MKHLLAVAGVLFLAVASFYGQTSKPAKKPAASQPTSLRVYTAWPFDANEAARRQNETAKALGVQTEMVLNLGANISMKLALIPAGKFMMGSPETEEGRYKDEVLHEVTFSKAFYMGMHEVTQEQYGAVMGKNPSGFKGAKNPVEEVSWDEAVEFCKKLSAKTGKTVRLPTEAEWEYSCRAGTNTPFHTGQTLSADQANCEGRGTTMPVGSFKPNNFGLYDMHGNVREWCSDWYDDKYYAQAKKVDPQGPTRQYITGKYGNRADRVLRGGSWPESPRYCRSALRSQGVPSNKTANIGFRIVVSPASD